MAELFWMFVSKQYSGPAGTSLTVHGLAATSGDGVVYEIWPSEAPEHAADFVTLTVILDEEVVEEVGRFPSYAAAKAAAARACLE